MVRVFIHSRTVVVNRRHNDSIVFVYNYSYRVVHATRRTVFYGRNERANISIIEQRANAISLRVIARSIMAASLSFTARALIIR